MNPVLLDVSDCSFPALVRTDSLIFFTRRVSSLHSNQLAKAKAFSALTSRLHRKRSHKRFGNSCCSRRRLAMRLANRRRLQAVQAATTTAVDVERRDAEQFASTSDSCRAVCCEPSQVELRRVVRTCSSFDF